MARLGESERGIVVDFLPMARSMARRFAVRIRLPGQYDELMSAAYEGLCEAAGTFDPARGVVFPVFARRRIFGAMADLARWLRGQGETRRRAMVEFAEPPDRPIDEPGPTYGDLIEEAEAFIRTLPVNLKPLARLLLIDGLTQGQAAGELGCTPGYVCRLHRQITERIGRFAA